MKKRTKKTAKGPIILKNDVNDAEKLQRKSIDELKKIARLRGTKNRDELTIESLIISLLKSESNNAERNYMKHFNKNTNDDNKANDDTYDGKIRDKITDVRMILSKLGNIVADNDRKKIKKELSETENKKNLLDNKKEKNYYHLIELVSTLNKKEKYNHHDRDDLNYHGMRDLEKPS